MYLNLLLPLLFASFVADVSAESEPAPCQCTFTDTDAEDCRVYGQLGDGDIIGWHRASQECLDVFKIKDQAIDPEMLTSMFPNSDGTGGNPTQFVVYLRFTDGSVATGIKQSFDQFFAKSETQPGKTVLKDEIIIDGVIWVCSSEQGGNAGSCWTAIRGYFSTEPGSSEMAAVGKSLYDQQAVSREKEQSLVRIRLCSDGATDECGLLSEQVQQVMKANPDKFCSAYGLGPAGYSYPRCDGAEVMDVSDEDGTSASAITRGEISLAVAAAAMALQGVIFA